MSRDRGREGERERGREEERERGREGEREGGREGGIQTDRQTDRQPSGWVIITHLLYHTIPTKTNKTATPRIMQRALNPEDLVNGLLVCAHKVLLNRPQRKISSSQLGPRKPLWHLIQE